MSAPVNTSPARLEPRPVAFAAPLAAPPAVLAASVVIAPARWRLWPTTSLVRRTFSPTASLLPPIALPALLATLPVAPRTSPAVRPPFAATWTARPAVSEAISPTWLAIPPAVLPAVPAALASPPATRFTLRPGLLSSESFVPSFPTEGPPKLPYACDSSPANALIALDPRTRPPYPYATRHAQAR